MAMMHLIVSGWAMTSRMVSQQVTFKMIVLAPLSEGG